MDCMWRAEIGFGFDISPINYLEERWIARVCGAIDDMDIGRAHAGHQKIFARH